MPGENMPVDKVTATDAILSFRGSMWECFPRMLWQRLFNFYRDQGCPLDHMDNMLIDLENCKELFVGIDCNTVKFLWGCDPCHWSTTWRWEKSWDGTAKETARWMSYDFVVLCEVNNREARFTRVGTN